VILQKYLHDLKRWNELPVEMQERNYRPYQVVRTIELDDASKTPNLAAAQRLGRRSSKRRATGDRVRVQQAIRPYRRTPARRVRHLFHRLCQGPPHRIEQMLVNMFRLARPPPGTYDRPPSTSIQAAPVTGNALFFSLLLPSATVPEHKCVAIGEASRRPAAVNRR